MVTLRSLPKIKVNDIIDYRLIEGKSDQYEIRMVTEVIDALAGEVKAIWFEADPGWIPNAKDVYNFHGTSQTKPDTSALEAELSGSLEDKKQRLRISLAKEIALYKEQLPRRRDILELAIDILQRTDRVWFGKPNEFYIGPDVTNEKFIFLVGAKSNLPIKQMETDGKRTSAVGKRKKPKPILPDDLGI